MQSAQQAVHPWFVSYPGVGTGSHKQLSLSTLVLEVSLSIATEDCNFLVHRRSMKSKWRDSVNSHDSSTWCGLSVPDETEEICWLVPVKPKI